MTFSYQNSISVAEYNNLRTAVGWSAFQEEQVAIGLANSARVVACCLEGEAIGHARLIWDGGCLAYLADVMILPAYQGHGIGRNMVTMLLDYLRAQLKPGWSVVVVLVATKGKEAFYKKFGFVERPNEEEGPGMTLRLFGEETR